jgi:hypothetical protein
MEPCMLRITFARCKSSTPRVTYADTHCAFISMTDEEHSAQLQRAQLQRAHKFCVCAAANS